MTNQTQTPLRELIESAFTAPMEVDLSHEKNLLEKMADLERQIDNFRAVKRSQFLPYEASVALQFAKEKRKNLESMVRVIKKDLDRVKETQRLQEMHIYVAKSGYPEQLDLTPLTNRNGRGDPMFMVSPVDNRSGVCEIRVGQNEWTEKCSTKFKPKLPRFIENKLSKAVHRSVRASFAGYAENSEVRKEIEKAKRSRLFDEIIVIAEAPEWTRIKGDPIIAGCVNETEQLYFITAYDMTPIEQYFRDQGAYGVTIPNK